MKVVRMLGLALAAAFVVSFLTLPRMVRADEWDQTTKITFTEPVQIPGTVLPAGTYTFRLMRSDSNRNIVQVFDEDQMKLYATVLAIPDYRTETTADPVVLLDERPVDQPEAIRAWFYPGDNYGHEFVYTNWQQSANEEASGSSGLSRRPGNLIAQSTASTPPAQNATAPAGQPLDQNSSAAQTTIPSQSAPAATGETQLPKTASELPLFGLVGVFLIAIALVLRRKLRA